MAFTFPFYLFVASAFFFFFRVDFYSKNLKKNHENTGQSNLAFLVRKDCFFRSRYITEVTQSLQYFRDAHISMLFAGHSQVLFCTTTE